MAIVVRKQDFYKHIHVLVCTKFSNATIMECIFDPEFADKVALMTYEKFKMLPKKGKPQKGKEWTLLSSIAMSIQKDNNITGLKIVALCSGTKCLGKSQLSKDGDVVNDSHAEILSRRSFIRFLLGNMALVLKGEKSEVLEWHVESGHFVVKNGVKFHLFSSHTPCGDASIFPKISTVVKRNIHDIADIGPVVKKAKIRDEASDPSVFPDMKSSNIKESESDPCDIYRTGAKCVPSGLQDPKAPGQDYHVTGALRTKPGRGDPTCSMSCSDKIALWNVCGIQGALCSHLLESPIYLSSIIIGKCAYDRSALERAVIGRIDPLTDLPNKYCLSRPILLQSSTAFEYSKDTIKEGNSRIVPCSAAIIWNELMRHSVDVCVNGRRQGITKKDIAKSSSWVSVCRINILKNFLETLKMLPNGCFIESLRTCVDESTYLQYKKASLSYQKAKSSAFSVFKGWMNKPQNLQMFVINDSNK